MPVEHPFERELNQENRWVALYRLIPRDELCAVYRKHVGSSKTGRPGLSPRIVIGSLIIKYMCNLDDREMVEQISENIYMQYFSLFVDFRKLLGMDTINEKTVALKTGLKKPAPKENRDD